MEYGSVVHEKYWLKQLKTFFKRVAPPLNTILDADGVIELWLQGEMFRYFSAKEKDWFYVGDTKRDVVAYEDKDEDPTLIMEIKVSCRGKVQPKFLTGFGDMRPYPGSGRYTFSAKDKCNTKEGSLLKDFQKLTKYSSTAKAKPHGCLCMFIYVSGTEAVAGDRFKEAMEVVEFGSPRKVIYKDRHIRAFAWIVRT